MSDTPSPDLGSSEANIVDMTIQRSWDRFANPDLSLEPESHRSPLAPTSPGSTNAINAIRAFGSLAAHDSTTVLGATSARAASIELDEEDSDAPDRGAC